MQPNQTQKLPTPSSPKSAHSARDFRQFLQDEFIARAERNSRYNLSAFARSLDIDVSTLSKILRGVRVVRKHAIERFGLKLGLSPLQIEDLQSRSPRTNARAKNSLMLDKAHEDRQRLSLDEFQLISDWYHYAILELRSLPHFRNDLGWIAGALKVSETEVRCALERLERLGLIEFKADGAWVDVSGGYTTTLGNSFSAAAFRKLQKKVLEGAIDALENIPFEKRHQSSVTMAIETEKLPEAKRLMVEFQRSLNKLLSPSGSKNLDEVYHLGLSLYPVSNSQKKSIKNKKEPNT